ncbi:GNAT family N-acetyltransferase [Flavobacterium sp. UBA4854]|nr:GNAT family N-acetyltransferase [Flavobacterium sp. UBA4854]
MVGEIQEFFIRQKYRGQGIGRLLINEDFRFC